MMFYDFRKETEQSYPEGQTGQHTCRTRLHCHADSLQNHFPFQGTVTQIVTTTTRLYIFFWPQKSTFWPQPIFYPLFLHEDSRIRKNRPSKLHNRI